MGVECYTHVFQMIAGRLIMYSDMDISNTYYL